MRPYGTVSPLFWTGKTGKNLRTDRDAQVVALYLMTSPHSHGTGLFYLPLMYLAHETGIPLEGARKALASLSKDGFCLLDEVSEWIWVREMAAWQIGSNLNDKDKRCYGVRNYLETVPNFPLKAEFIKRYQDDFHLPEMASPSEAPSKVATSSGSGSGSGTGGEQGGAEAPPVLDLTGAVPPFAKPPRVRKSSRVPADFRPDLSYARKEIPDIDAEREAQKFRDWEFKTPKSDWAATWRNWIGNCRDRGVYAKQGGTTRGGGDNGLEYLNP